MRRRSNEDETRRLALAQNTVRPPVWALELAPGERVLEVGFGPGVAIDAIVRSSQDVVVVGMDHSEVMLRQATSRNAAAVAAGRVHLHLASVEDPPAFDEPFHKIFAINSVGFWRDPVTRLESLRELLVPGGTLVLTVQPRGVGIENPSRVEKGVRPHFHETT